MSGKTTSVKSATTIRPDADAGLRQEMARSGDVGGILDLLDSMRPDILLAGELLDELRTAVGVKTRQDPEAFARETFARMAAMSAYLLFRAQHLLSLRVEGHSRAPWGQGRLDLPPDIENALARLWELQHHVGELLQAQAAVARSWALTKAKARENKRRRRRRGGNDKPIKCDLVSEDCHTPVRGNGRSLNRIASLHGGTAHTDGAGRDE